MTDDDCPEFNGFNTAIARTNGQQLEAKTNMQYIPLIDMTPHDPDTMMTSLTQAQEITTSMGQNYVVYTCDLQLYKVAQSILWAYPDRFKNVVLRLGGMHMLMSFIGAVGSLMIETGLNDVLESVFGKISYRYKKVC